MAFERTMNLPEISAGTALKLTEQLEPQWLIDALNHFKKKHKSSYDVLTKLTRNDSPPTMRQLLEIGLSLEKELKDRHNPEVEDLVDHQDLSKRLIRIGKNNLAFEPYQKAGETIRKYVKDNIREIPVFEGIGEPEGHGQACKDHIKAIGERRFQFVEQYLSKTHQYYAKKNIGAKMSSVAKEQVRNAELWLARNSRPATRYISNLPSGPPESIVVHATTRPIFSPIEVPLPERVSHEHSDRTPVRGFRAVQREGFSASPFTPRNRKRLRVDSEQVPAEIELPISNSCTTNIHSHVPSLEIEPKSNVPVKPNPINAVALGTQPTLPANYSLLQSAMTKVREECGEELDSLMKETPCGLSATPLDRAIRACNFGLKNGPCEPHQRIVATLKKWVLDPGDEEPISVYDIEEIEAEILKRRFEDKNQVEKQLLELYASRMVEQKMILINSRRNAVFSLMTVDDRDALDVRIRQERGHLKNAELKDTLFAHIRSMREKLDASRRTTAHQTRSPTSEMYDFLSREQP